MTAVTAAVDAAFAELVLRHDLALLPPPSPSVSAAHPPLPPSRSVSLAAAAMIQQPLDDGSLYRRATTMKQCKTTPLGATAKQKT